MTYKKKTPTSLRFTKMHGLGNDFVIVNATDESFKETEISIPALANRHTGIGFDQLLIVSPSKKADFFCRIFNADGSEAEQCGNGLRCVARFLHEENLIQRLAFHLETRAGVYPLTIRDYNHITIAMGEPSIQSALIELSLRNQHALPISIISIGNSHAIVKVNAIDSILTNQLGREIATHPHFASSVNVGFMQVIDRKHIRLKTFERGVGETNACGSNACAAVVAGIINGWLKNSVQVEFKYGSLQIDLKKNKIHMMGPASRVFTGETL